MADSSHKEQKFVRKDLKSVHEDMFLWSEKLSEHDASSNHFEVHISINSLSEKWRPYSVSFNEQFNPLNPSLNHGICAAPTPCEQNQQAGLYVSHSVKSVDFDQVSNFVSDVHTALLAMACQLQAVSDVHSKLEASKPVQNQETSVSPRPQPDTKEMELNLAEVKNALEDASEVEVIDPFSMLVDDVLESEECNTDPNRNSMMLFSLSENFNLHNHETRPLQNSDNEGNEVVDNRVKQEVVVQNQFNDSQSECQEKSVVRQLSFNESVQNGNFSEEVESSSEEHVELEPIDTLVDKNVLLKEDEVSDKKEFKASAVADTIDVSEITTPEEPENNFTGPTVQDTVKETHKANEEIGLRVEMPDDQQTYDHTTAVENFSYTPVEVLSNVYVSTTATEEIYLYESNYSYSKSTTNENVQEVVNTSESNEIEDESEFPPPPPPEVLLDPLPDLVGNDRDVSDSIHSEQNSDEVESRSIDNSPQISDAVKKSVSFAETLESEISVDILPYNEDLIEEVSENLVVIKDDNPNDEINSDENDSTNDENVLPKSDLGNCDTVIVQVDVTKTTLNQQEGNSLEQMEINDVHEDKAWTNICIESETIKVETNNDEGSTKSDSTFDAIVKPSLNEEKKIVTVSPETSSLLDESEAQESEEEKKNDNVINIATTTVSLNAPNVKKEMVDKVCTPLERVILEEEKIADNHSEIGIESKETKQSNPDAFLSDVETAKLKDQITTVSKVSVTVQNDSEIFVSNVMSTSSLTEKKKKLFTQKKTWFESKDGDQGKQLPALNYKQKQSGLVKAKLEALQQTTWESKNKNDVIEDELQQLRLSRSSTKSTSSSLSSDSNRESLTTGLETDNPLSPVGIKETTGEQTSPPPVDVKFFAAKPFHSLTPSSGGFKAKKITFHVKPPTAPKPQLKPIVGPKPSQTPPIPTLPEIILLEKEFPKGGGLQPFTSRSKKPKYRSVNFSSKKQSTNPLDTTAIVDEPSEKVKPVHISQDSGIECFQELFPVDDVTELPQSSTVHQDDQAHKPQASETTQSVDNLHGSSQKPEIPPIEPAIIQLESTEPLHNEVSADENSFHAPEPHVPVLVPLNSDKDDNQQYLSHSDLDERAYTDDDIDDFTDDDLNEPQNSNNNNLHGVKNDQYHNSQLIAFEKDLSLQLLHSDAAVLMHDTNGELAKLRSVENTKGSQPSNEDFVQPPLPPPPSDAFLGSQTSMHSPIGNGVKSYKSVKPAIWSPTPKPDEDLPLPPPPNANEMPMSSLPPVQPVGKPKGFRSVSMPVSKDQGDDNNMSATEVPYPGPDRLSPHGNRSGMLSPFNDGVQVDRPLSSLSNSSQSSGYVTLLRDTRKILIKPANTAASPKVDTSSTFSFQGTPFPTPPNTDATVTPASQLPEGAVYQTTTQEGDLVHTDTYYPATGNGADNKSVVLERTKKTTVVRAPHHTGIGPVNDSGVPYALRTTVDDSKHWYKNMFKQMHKIEKDDVDDGSSSSANDVTPVNDRMVQHHASMEIEKPKKVGRITDYQPAEPYVVENKPIKLNLNAPEKPRRRRVVHRPNTDQSYVPGIQRSSSLEDFTNMQWGDFFDDILKPKPRGTIWDMEASEQTKNTVPVASTSYKPPAARKTVPAPETAVSASSYTAYRNAMSGQTKSPQPQTATKQGKQDEANKLRQPARAKFDFSAQTSKELPAKKGQTLIVTRRVDDNWYMAETVDGKKSGIIPVQYIEIISTATSPEKPVRNGQGKAKFDFTGKTKVELSFKQGDEILLLKKVDANWYKGKIGGTTGILPAVYIDVIVEPESAEAVKTKPKIPKELEASPKTTTSPRTASSLSSQHSHSLSQASSNSDPDESERKQRAAFLAHSVVDATIQLQPKDANKHRGEFDLSELDRVVESLNDTQATTGTDGDFPAPPPAQALLAPSVPSYPSSNISSQPSSPRLQTPPPNAPEVDFGHVIGRYVALYAYEASNDDELDLIPGDVIMVVEVCDDGWYVGTCQRTGAFGTFPGNYVTPANS